MTIYDEVDFWEKRRKHYVDDNDNLIVVDREYGHILSHGSPAYSRLSAYPEHHGLHAAHLLKGLGLSIGWLSLQLRIICKQYCLNLIEASRENVFTKFQVLGVVRQFLFEFQKEVIISGAEKPA